MGPQDGRDGLLGRRSYYIALIILGRDAMFIIVVMIFGSMTKHDRTFDRYAVQIRIAFGEPRVSALLAHAD